MQKLARILNRSIASKLTAWFLLIAVVPCAILALVTYRLSESALEDNSREKLFLTAENKAKTIEAYAYDHIRSATALSRTKTFRGRAVALRIWS
jgi:hypothetical protein